MNQNFNPYQAPQSQEYLPQQTGECWREGKRVFLPDGADLPRRCIRCGEAAEPQRRPRKLYWYHPAWNLLIIPMLFGFWPVALIISLVVRKTLIIHPALCPQHQKQMRWLFWGVPAIVLVLMLLPLTALFIPSLSNYFSSTFIAMWYCGIITFCPIFAAATSPMRPRLVKVTEDYNVLKNFGRGFLNTLPEEYELDSRR